MAHHLQSGIYFESGTKPPAAYRLLLINGVNHATATEIRAALEKVHHRISELRAGRPAELEDQPELHASASRDLFGSLDMLLGYGRRVFDEDVHDPPITNASRPEFLSYLATEGDPFPGLPWQDARTLPQVGEADFALQFTGETQAVVNCAAVEVWKEIVDSELPLEAIGSFDGFGRSDGRGWLEFHDGVSNMASGARLEALQALADPGWMRGGTYMALLRVMVDLSRWRAFGRSKQELLVGRDKLSGAALADVKVNQAGEFVPIARPFRGAAAGPLDLAAWRDPPETTHPLLEASHIHRANQSRGSPSAPGSLRMFRQGYEFLEDIGPQGPVLGLNFVSFQKDLRSFQHVLHLPGWLGDVNFGGLADEGPEASTTFLTLAAGGFYAVPPRSAELPGSSLFTTN